MVTLKTLTRRTVPLLIEILIEMFRDVAHEGCCIGTANGLDKGLNALQVVRDSPATDAIIAIYELTTTLHIPSCSLVGWMPYISLF